MQHIAMRDVAMVKEVPNSARMLMFNGELLLTADQLAQTCFLMVNGRLRLDEFMTPELIVDMVAGGMVNGELIAGEKQLGGAIAVRRAGKRQEHGDSRGIPPAGEPLADLRPGGGGHVGGVDAPGKGDPGTGAPQRYCGSGA